MSDEPEAELTGVAKALTDALRTREAPLRAVAPAPDIAKRSAPKGRGRLRLRRWAPVPEGVGEVEALTYVPGLVGEIVEWTVATAPRPNRMMAMGSALAVIGTLIGRRVMGPTDSATHLFLVILFPSGWGKDRPLNVGFELVETVAPDLVGPSEFASAPGLVEHLLAHPCAACFVDEFGDLLKLVRTQGNNSFVSDIVPLLKKCYNAWGRIKTAPRRGHPSETLVWPAVSLVGAATPEMFYGQLDPADIESGFLNRFMVLPYEGYRRPREQIVPKELRTPPQALIADLKALHVPTSLGIDILKQVSSGVVGEDGPKPGQVEGKREEFGWTAEAEAEYVRFSRCLDDLQDRDKRRYELMLRAQENASRLATIVSAGRGAERVEVEDMRWAIRMAELSAANMQRDLAKYLREYFDFPKSCDVIWQAALNTQFRFISKRTCHRQFGRSQRHGFELDRATAQLVKEGRFVACQGREHATGPLTDGWRAIEDDGEEGNGKGQGV
jgi:hypothetical protein